MATGNLLDIQLEHDKWATRQLLLTCEKLTPEQFSRKFDMGPGSLQAAITHMLAAMNAWTDTLVERPSRPRIDQNGVSYSPAQLIEMHDVSTTEFMAIARDRPLDQVVKRAREGVDYFFTRAAVISQVTTHGMHHRAQCLNMLKQLGVKPLPLSSVAEWTRFGEGAQ